MTKPNPVEVVFKAKAKFDMQNSIISTLLTQIQSGKTRTEKAIENQLKAAWTIRDLQIANKLKCLKQYKKRNDGYYDNNDDDNTLPPPASTSALSCEPPLYYPQLPSIDSDDNSYVEGENPIQKFVLGDRPHKDL